MQYEDDEMKIIKNDFALCLGMLKGSAELNEDEVLKPVVDILFKRHQHWIYEHIPKKKDEPLLD